MRGFPISPGIVCCCCGTAVLARIADADTTGCIMGLGFIIIGAILIQLAEK